MDRALIAAAAVVVTACGLRPATPAPPEPDEAPAPGDAAAGTCADTHGQLVLERVNEIRREHGLRPVRVAEQLVEAALAHAADVAERGPAAVGHIGADGSAPGDRVTAAGYPWRLVAENVAAGMPAPAGVVAAWMQSPPHRSTILAPDAIHSGVGYVDGYERGVSHYWVLLVAAAADPAGARILPCHP